MRRFRFAAILLLLPLLFCACGSRFAPNEQGTGYIDAKKDRVYLALSTAFEAAAREGEAVGEYRDKAHGRTVTFYPIPGLDAAEFLTDGNAFVYCAKTPAPNAENWQIDAILVCEEDAVSVEKQRLADEATLLAVRAAWFEGEQSELPFGKAEFVRRLKLTCAEYPSLYYCFNFYAYADGSAFFRDAESGRVAACPAELAAILRAA